MEGWKVDEKEAGSLNGLCCFVGHGICARRERKEKADVDNSML